MIELSSLSEFIKFDVVMNEIPIAKMVGEILDSEYAAMSEHERGKDVVMNWEFLDGFNTDHNMWIDFNGLDMQQKRLWERKEFKYNKTENIASNFYPVTSAIAIRDKNSSKQVTVMTDRSQAGSAGLRKSRNIELMQNRRLNGHDSYGISDHVDERDSSNIYRGEQTKATYYM